METFELRCACSATIPVVAGQAGGRARCPSCGVEQPVPRLGALRRLGTSSHAGQASHALHGGSGGTASASSARTTDIARRPWSIGHACLLAGGIVALAASLGAWQYGSTPTGSSWVDEVAIRQLVRSSSLDAVLRAWQVFERNGPQPPPPNQERRERAASTIASLLWVIASAGAVVAAGGAAAILSTRLAPPERSGATR
jgi:hypothetical protein